MTWARTTGTLCSQGSSTSTVGPSLGAARAPTRADTAPAACSYSQPTLARAEAVLSDLIGKPTIVYSSGLAAAYSLFIHYQPSVVAITRGYPGVHSGCHRISLAICR